MTSIAAFTPATSAAIAQSAVAQSAPVSAATSNTSNTAIASTTNASVTAQASVSSSITQQAATPSISPHITVDPVAGVITQYLNSAGKVESQFPSNVAIAYLRAGLDAHGFSKTHDAIAAASKTA